MTARDREDAAEPGGPDAPAEPDRPAGPDSPAAPDRAGERHAELLDRLDVLTGLFERRILDDREKRRQVEELRDGPFRQHLHPLVHRLALLIDRLDQEADGAQPDEDAPVAPERALARSVRDELLEALAAHGVREIAGEGPFDPVCQEAAEVVRDSSAEPGTVDRVVRRGFAHGDWVFRPARVAVVAARG
ncbi:nucleotide exchange factor GrpE [Streptomyces otsuchiensis]|uniref:nucleotide exchange factor GrpE n=1 Tax=Streptomyces otsuchiensis TaxID=2681388 RepID=UPI001031AFA1|nr:nucleotide exchange factor GrpE [Streptomyces otsuchiensis]